jgi:hypothetical protein
MTDQDRILFASPDRPAHPATFDLSATMQQARELRAQALKGMLARALAGAGGGRPRVHPVPCGSAG